MLHSRRTSAVKTSSKQLMTGCTKKHKDGATTAVGALDFYEESKARKFTGRNSGVHQILRVPCVYGIPGPLTA